ncbi:hypothetical protein DFA_00481 [Cavenderia fasciculata]|uniref:Uncharacterized protein n=1 Tax=Cavenderia fasciculata TaxID=261658 RepID=F4PS22_CACFS|nr:uncharacterized protein DFA_00481 [Cavenderia fasciculata]EGG20620.1 hypothetical protein DFA_00481 [Cavenderia fasciculata]|eukprot:XP_004358470.1 hypothetical protein DFA_00481 [Cavenderia fasciculata]
MEKPDKEFIEIFDILIDQQIKKMKYDHNNNNSRQDNEKRRKDAKQLFKQYTISKPDKLVSWLLYLMVKGTYPNTTLSDIFLRHLIGIIVSFAKYLIPTEQWFELGMIVETIQFGEEYDSILLENTKELMVYATYDFKMDKKEILLDLIKNFRISKLARGTVSIIHAHAIIDGIVDGELLDDIVESLSGILDNNPQLMKEISPQISITLIEVLDRHREKGFKNNDTKNNIFEYLAETFPTRITDRQIDRIIVHLTEWLIQEKSMVLEDWAYSDDSQIDLDDNLCNFIYDQVLFNDIKYSKDHLSSTVATISRFVVALDRIARVIFDHFIILLNSKSWKERYLSLMTMSDLFNKDPVNILAEEEKL